MQYPDHLKAFMIWYKGQSEQYFSTLKEGIDTLQSQKEIKWRSGLSDHELNAFQQELGFDFPEELIEWYRAMNGTDSPVVNICDKQNDQYHSVCLQFSYPEHLPEIKRLMQKLMDINGLTIEQMKEERTPFIFPVGNFEFMVIDNITNPIYYLSIFNKNHDLNQAYVYGSLIADNLQSWLIKQTFQLTSYISDLQEFPDKQRTANYWTTKEDDYY